MKLTKNQYDFLCWTWGIILTVIGEAIATVLCFFANPIPYKYGKYFIIGKGWGGVSIGPVTIVSEEFNLKTLNHEFGHSLQNCMYGPLTIFIVCIPSVVRYWYRKVVKKTNPEKKLPGYYDIWFEAQASEWGSKEVVW